MAQELKNFSKFYDQHFDAVYRFVYFRVSQNRAVAEDLTADIFTSALEAFQRFNPDLGSKAWIMTIARNKVINHWRDKKDSVDIDELAFSLEGEDGIAEAEKADDIRHLTKALHALKPQERLLIERKYLLGYHYQEVAIEIKKSVGAVRVETHRAMKKLKKLLRY